MSMTELKTWRIECDHCHRSGGVVSDTHRPNPPKGWEYATVHDCGLTGYTRHDLLCDSCSRKAKGIK